jgi:hypothetical protein
VADAAAAGQRGRGGPEAAKVASASVPPPPAAAAAAATAARDADLGNHSAHSAMDLTLDSTPNKVEHGAAGAGAAPLAEHQPAGLPITVPTASHAALPATGAGALLPAVGAIGAGGLAPSGHTPTYVDKDR